MNLFLVGDILIELFGDLDLNGEKKARPFSTLHHNVLNFIKQKEIL